MSFYRRWDFSSLCLLLEFLTFGLLVCASVILTYTTWCKAAGWQLECLMISKCERGCPSSLGRGTEEPCPFPGGQKGPWRSRGSRRTNAFVITSLSRDGVSQMLTLLSKIGVLSFFVNHCWFTLCRRRGGFLVVATAPDSLGLEIRFSLLAAWKCKLWHNGTIRDCEKSTWISFQDDIDVEINTNQSLSLDSVHSMRGAKTPIAKFLSMPHTGPFMLEPLHLRPDKKSLHDQDHLYCVRTSPSRPGGEAVIDGRNSSVPETLM